MPKIRKSVQEYLEKFEIVLSPAVLSKEDWKAFQKALKREYRKVSFPAQNCVLVYSRRGMMTDFLAKALVYGTLSDFLDKRYPVCTKEYGENGTRKLPICDRPEASAYLFYSTKLCIVQTCRELSDWLLNNFINIKMYYHPKDNNRFFFEETLESVFEFQRKTAEEMNAVEDIIAYTRDALQNGWYLDIHLDAFYLSETDYYQRYHYVHESLIYGYDDSRQEIYAYGFCRNQKLRLYVITYTEYICAYEKGKIFYFCGAPYLEDSYPYPADLRRLKGGVQEVFSLSSFRSSVRSYLYPAKSEMTEGSYHVYGIHVLDYIIECLEQDDNRVIDFRVFQLLYDQKKCILHRIEVLAERCRKEQSNLAQISMEYKAVAEGCQRIRFACLRQLKTEGVVTRLDKTISDRGVSLRIADELREITLLEKQILEKLI